MLLVFFGCFISLHPDVIKVMLAMCFVFGHLSSNIPFLPKIFRAKIGRVQFISLPP